MENSECLNYAGGFKCGECMLGFTGNQTVGCYSYCNGCAKNAICEFAEDTWSHNCVCATGFAGNGKENCGKDSDLDGFPDEGNILKIISKAHSFF